ncbi:hypothetical protein BC830DRAFT_1078389 [Chytriomyces sp. MP71]|nr:hypothetical protein BC830DRAFT_1078389 [Chytriomyces sp. MP71]
MYSDQMREKDESLSCSFKAVKILASSSNADNLEPHYHAPAPHCAETPPPSAGQYGRAPQPPGPPPPVFTDSGEVTAKAMERMPNQIIPSRQQPRLVLMGSHQYLESSSLRQTSPFNLNVNAAQCASNESPPCPLDIYLPSKTATVTDVDDAWTGRREFVNKLELVQYILSGNLLAETLKGGGRRMATVMFGVSLARKTRSGHSKTSRADYTASNAKAQNREGGRFDADSAMGSPYKRGYTQICWRPSLGERVAVIGANIAYIKEKNRGMLLTLPTEVVTTILQGLVTSHEISGVAALARVSLATRWLQQLVNGSEHLWRTHFNAM